MRTAIAFLCGLMAACMILPVSAQLLRRNRVQPAFQYTESTTTVCQNGVCGPAVPLRAPILAVKAPVAPQAAPAAPASALDLGAAPKKEEKSALKMPAADGSVYYYVPAPEVSGEVRVQAKGLGIVKRLRLRFGR